MISPPAAAIAMPIQVEKTGRSPSRGPDPIATNSGDVVTRKTEVATDVCFTEAIQNVKCKASKSPDSRVSQVARASRFVELGRLIADIASNGIEDKTSR